MHKVPIIVLDKTKFSEFILSFYEFSEEEVAFLFTSYEGLITLIKGHLELQPNLNLAQFDNGRLIFYLLHDFVYRKQLINVPLNVLIDDEQFMTRFLNSVLDKYTSLTNYKYEHDKLLSRYSMPISTLAVYVNFILLTLDNAVSAHKNSYIVKLLKKAFVYTQTISELLVNGLESEALSVWRSLHEVEAILILISDKNTLKSYEKHLTYSAAFHKMLPKAQSDEIFVQIKAEMKALGLKSKDTKKYIEYGFISAHPSFKSEINLFNFKAGLQALAGLSSYDAYYKLASELAHSSPVSFFHGKKALTLVALVLVYETFLRLEQLFHRIYLAFATPQELAYYEHIRAMYLADIKQILLLNKHKLNK